MKKALILLAVLTVSLVAVWGWLHTHQPEYTATQTLDALQHGNFTLADTYTLSGWQLPIRNAREEELYTSILGAMEYTIDRTVEDQNVAEIRLTITSVDVNGILTELSYAALENSLRGDSTGWSDGYRQLIEQIEAGAGKTQETEAVMTLKKTNKSWKVDTEQSEDLRSILTGGLEQ